MTWENRNGNSYYYRKRREGKRVFSEYVGCGEVAGLIVQLERLERWEKEKNKLETRRKRAENDEIDNKLAEISQFNQNLVDALFLASGFHQHKRQWRKKRK